jgi:hypothetical protein
MFCFYFFGFGGGGGFGILGTFPIRSPGLGGVGLGVGVVGLSFAMITSYSKFNDNAVYVSC